MMDVIHSPDQTDLLAEVEQRFKQERKALQAKIQALKKSATKGDKKKKKEVQEEIALLEADLDRRQQEEEERARQSSSVDVSDNAENADEPVTAEISMPSQPRTTKAEKRRQKKATASKERDARIQEQEETNLQGPRHKEMCAIVKKLRDRGLAIHSIVADGNCLYSAVEHQLQGKGISHTKTDCASLRKLTAEHLRKNVNEFLPFLSNPDTNDTMSENDFEKYCKKVETTTAWGGQIELRALSNELKFPIEVIQADGPPLVIGDEYQSVNQPLVVTFHRFMYRLGEHYNSVTAYNEEDQET